MSLSHLTWEASWILMLQDREESRWGRDWGQPRTWVWRNIKFEVPVENPNTDMDLEFRRGSGHRLGSHQFMGQN